ncbi:MAG: hypothetical protein ACTMIK_04955 [Galactobacter sp.]
MARDFRRFLATMPSDAYSDVLDVLEPYIGSALPTQQLLAAYLAPERTDWSETVVRSLNEMPRVPAWLVSRTAVSDDQGNAQLELPPLALQLVHTEAELHQIYPRVSNWSLTGESGELLAMVQWLGAAAVPAVESIAMEDDPIANLLKLAAAVLGSIPADAAMTALLRHSEDKRMRAALLESVDRYPRRALRVLAQHDPKDSQVQDLLTTRVRADRALAAEVAAELEATPSGTNEGAAAAQRITDLLSVEQVPQADPDQLPRVLVSPPWLQKRKRTKPVVIEGLDTEAGVIVEWLPGERDDYLATKPAFRAPDAKFSWGACRGPVRQGASKVERLRDVVGLRAGRGFGAGP